jgi:hypothetical protein
VLEAFRLGPARAVIFARRRSRRLLGDGAREGHRGPRWLRSWSNDRRRLVRPASRGHEAHRGLADRSLDADRRRRVPPCRRLGREARFGSEGAGGAMGIIVGSVVDGVPESLILGIQVGVISIVPPFAPSHPPWTSTGSVAASRAATARQTRASSDAGAGLSRCETPACVGKAQAWWMSREIAPSRCSRPTRPRLYLNFGGLGQQKATTRSGLRPKSTSSTILSQWRQYVPQAA